MGFGRGCYHPWPPKPSSGRPSKLRVSLRVLVDGIPIDRVARRQSRAVRQEKAWIHQNSPLRLPRKHGVDFEISDSSAEEDVREASAAPEPDAEILYSFDAPRGPAEGGQILSLALAKAVEKFETKETEKLVKTEYEVVGNEKEDAPDGYAADEDDFQLI